jgi:hypothetical protein
VISVPVAIINAASGVKSAVISIRSPRGRTPMPVDFRLAANNMTGIGRMCVSNSASFSTVRPLVGCEGGSSNEML